MKNEKITERRYNILEKETKEKNGKPEIRKKKVEICQNVFLDK